MKSNPVGWFEIPVTDMQRAKTFYQTVFQTKLEDMEMPGMEMAAFPMSEHATGASGALLKQDEVVPSSQPGINIYFECDDVNIELGRVEAAGGSIAFPKMSIGDHGFIAGFIDSEGNLISLHSMA